MCVMGCVSERVETPSRLAEPTRNMPEIASDAKIISPTPDGNARGRTPFVQVMPTISVENVYPCWDYYKSVSVAPVAQVQWHVGGEEIFFSVGGKIYGVAADGTELWLIADTRPRMRATLPDDDGPGYETYF